MAEATTKLADSLRKGVRNIRRGYAPEEELRGEYAEHVKLGLQRSILLTESYKMTEGQPFVLRRARAFEHILLNMNIYIKDTQLIVGNWAESANHLPHMIEHNWKSVQRSINCQEGRTLTDDAGRAKFNELVKYWDGKSISDVYRQLATADMKKYFEYDGTFLYSHWSEGFVPDYEKLLKAGLDGIIKEAEAKLKEIEERIPIDYIEQKDFLNAVIITCNAVIAFAHRFAAEARRLAKTEKSEQRRKQLERIAAVCDRVPANPAGTFQEAIQSFWFIHMITHQIEYITVGCGARLDVLMNPYYQKDRKTGRTTREQAMEVLVSLWSNFAELTQMYSPIMSGVYGGGHLLQTIVIGGVNSSGNDVTNEMSYMILDVVKELRLSQASLVLRYHDHTPKDLMLKAIDVIKTGIGYPAFFNDRVTIPRIIKWGFTEEEARNYIIYGCVYLHIPGKGPLRTGGGYVCLPKCLWWALRQGKDPRTGEQRGVPTPDPATFTGIEDVWQACLQQLKFFMTRRAQLDNLGKVISRRYIPRPFSSALLDGCIERGQDARDWSPPCSFEHAIMIGSTDTADSLAAIKKLVFDEKKLSLKEFINVLDKNWEGHEDLRQIVLNQVPKFGNDDDYVDSLAKKVHQESERVMEETLNPYGISYKLDGSGVAATYGLAFDCEATPNGRKDGSPFADATLSPSPGADMKGPTAVLLSCGKLDHVNTFNELLNQKFSPQFLEGPHKETFYSYLRTWAELGIPHIQFNIVDKAMLLDAQKHPEKYPNLLIRVAGYSVHFTDLSKGMQDNIIARTEQSLA